MQRQWQFQEKKIEVHAERWQFQEKKVEVEVGKLGESALQMA